MSKPKEPTVALVDADILCYRIGFASENDEEKYALSRVTEFFTDVVFFDVDCDKYEAFITGGGNFRKSVAVTAPYKGNRTAAKPKHYDAIRKHMVDKLNVRLVEGEEADDAIAIRATALGDDCIIISIDKDFDQVPGWHYNFVKKEKYYVTPEEGIRAFYKQILTGDRIDNIIGIKGIGPAKAEKAFKDCKTEIDLYKKCVEMYKGDKARVLENGQLLWLRRTEGELWQPPHVNDEVNGLPESKESEASLK